MKPKRDIIDYVDGKPIYRMPAPQNPRKLVVLQCPKCGANSAAPHKSYTLKCGIKRVRYKCGECNKTFIPRP